MRELWPRPDDDAAVEDRLAGEARQAPQDRPCVMVNMIATVDGATSVDGVSGGLGSDGDRRVFRALRALPDVILVGAATVRAERYGPPRPSAAVREQRTARGQDPTPRLAVVTRSGDLDPNLDLFTAEGPRPLVYLGGAASRTRRDALAGVAEVVDRPGDDVDLGDVLGDLRVRGAAVVLCEGGPSLNGQLVAAGLVDEWHLSLAPRLVAGRADRAAHGPLADPPLDMALHRVLGDDDDYLFLTHRRR